MRMRRVAWTLLIIVVCRKPPEATAMSIFTNEWAAHISGGLDDARLIAKRHGFDLVREIPNFDDHYTLIHRDVPHRSRRSADHHTARLSDEDQVHWAEQQVALIRVKRTSVFLERSDGSPDFNDPSFAHEWYLLETKETRQVRGSVVHMNMQVEGAWRKGYSGKNVVLTVLDDGLEHNNTDIQPNYDPYASTDINGNDSDPMPRYDPKNINRHGTRCAGEIAMVANNGKCGVGIAFNSKIGGIRMLDGKLDDTREMLSLTFNMTHIDIYTASWGPTDDGKTLEQPGRLVKQGFEKVVSHGRGGKGAIYVWAAGNGGNKGDNCNCDGFTVSIYTISVASCSEHGRAPSYLERCASTLTTTFSSGGPMEAKVVSTDLHNRCTLSHSGTSAAAPMAAAILALVLEANPSVTWRDAQHLVVLTSKPQPLMMEAGWYKNAAGFCVNLAFGFGLMDALDLVTTAHPDTWVNVPEKAICNTTTTRSSLPRTLTSGKTIEVLIETDGCQGQDNEVNYLEHVQFILTMTYSRRGALTVIAISPSGPSSACLNSFCPSLHGKQPTVGH